MPHWVMEKLKKLDTFMQLHLKGRASSAQLHISQLIYLDHKVCMATAQSCWAPIKSSGPFSLHIQTFITKLQTEGGSLFKCKQEWSYCMLLW